MEAADRQTKTYSGGMKRRLELARGLITKPRVLFLDEPTQGLDPQNRENIWEYIRTLKANTDTTLLLTTHYMDEAEALADHVGIMDHGKIIIEGSPRELIDQMGADNVRIMGRGNKDDFCTKVKCSRSWKASTPPMALFKLAWIMAIVAWLRSLKQL